MSAKACKTTHIGFGEFGLTRTIDDYRHGERSNFCNVHGTVWKQQASQQV
jgi:hypothetical protein